MTRGTKYFLFAIVGAVATWVVGTIMVGYADIRYFTNNGAVDMLNATAVATALRDPSFTATLTWSSFTLTGTYWMFSLPLLLAAIVFIAILLVGRFRAPRAAP